MAGNRVDEVLERVIDLALGIERGRRNELALKVELAALLRGKEPKATEPPIVSTLDTDALLHELSFPTLVPPPSPRGPSGGIGGGGDQSQPFVGDQVRAVFAAAAPGAVLSVRQVHEGLAHPKTIATTYKSLSVLCSEGELRRVGFGLYSAAAVQWNRKAG